MASKVFIGNIPGEIKDRPQWVGWKYEARDGKLTKIPKDPKTGENASSTDPSTWADIRQAVIATETYGLDGLGFVFTEADPFTGVDLDKCFAEAGELEPWARQIVERLDSYTEISPSGKGAHIILRGTLPPGRRRKGNIELYDCGRYFTMTGSAMNGRATIAERHTELEALYAEIFAAQEKEPINKPALPVEPLDLDDEELLSRARSAENGARFSKLFDSGDWKGADFKSQSEADLALCGMLAFRTGRDKERMDRLFRRSGLYRKKWDRANYRNATLDKAIADCREVYKPPRHKAEFCSECPPAEWPEGCSPSPPECRGKSSEGNLGAAKNKVYPSTDFGNAERFAAQHSENVRFCHTWGKWLIWSGKHWEIDETNQVFQLAKKTVRRMYAEASKIENEEDRKGASKHARASESSGRIQAMLALAQSEQSIAVTANTLDQNRWLFNVLNGTIDLKTGKLCPHRREDLITKIAPVICDPAPAYPQWDAFLKKIMAGSPGLISYLQKFTGYCLTGDTREKCLPVAYGVGDNGKTVFTATIDGMLGDYAQETPVETLMIKRNESIPNDVARLKGARLVTASEGERGQRLAESLIKRLTGGDKIPARFLHQEWFEFIPEFKILLSTNHKPIIRGGDAAIWNRIHLVPFQVIIPKSEQIPRTVMLDRLRQEWPGILKWAVEGCLLWQKEGLQKPKEVERATDDYRADSDIIGGFLSDCCILNPLAKCKTADLYSEYQKWCEGNKEDPLKARTFGSALEERGFERTRIGRRADKGFKGIGLKAHADPQTDADPIFKVITIKKDNQENKVKTGSASVCRSALVRCSNCANFRPNPTNPTFQGHCLGTPPDEDRSRFPNLEFDCPEFREKAEALSS